MEQISLISSTNAILITLLISALFVLFGTHYSKKNLGLNNYLVANRSIGTFSLTTSFIASALGAWILFGPASAATWGGIGAVIGYALGTAFPLLILINLGQKFRKDFPNGKTLIEVIRLKFGAKLFKFILFLSIFYMTIFLIAELTAVSILVNYISGVNLWITALIVITSSLIYTLYGGLRASIFTDNIQFLVFGLLLIIAFSYLFSFNTTTLNFEIIEQNKSYLISSDYIPNYTAGLTFFIAVAATNLFHQGNWQRVYAAKNNLVLKKSLIISFFVIIPVVFMMGFTGIIAISENSSVIADLAFFSLLLKKNSLWLSVLIIFLAISLTVSSIDTLINAISSLVVVDAKKMFKFKVNYLNFSKKIIIVISIVSFFVASKGLSILYLFLLADVFCCAAVLTLFASFYGKKISEKNILISMFIGLVSGILVFPSPDFSMSIFFGLIIPLELVPSIISQSLLFISFISALLMPCLAWKLK